MCPGLIDLHIHAPQVSPHVISPLLYRNVALQIDTDWVTQTSSFFAL